MPTHIHEMSPAQLVMAAQRLRELMTPVTWIKQDYCQHNDIDSNEPYCFCLMGAVIEAVYPGTDFDEAGHLEHDAGQFVANAIEEFDVAAPCKAVIDWNDHVDRTWEEVDAVVNRIVQHYAWMAPVAPYPRNEEGFV